MDKIYKVIVVGDPAVGKRELVAKLDINQLDQVPIVGTSIFKLTIELSEYNVAVNLMLWDIAGQPQFYMYHRPYFHGADGMLLVFDLTRSSTFSNINNWYSTAVKYGLSEIPRILIGNNAHVKGQRKIILPMAEHLSEKLNTHYYETSSLTGYNVKEVFEKIAELIYRAKELDEPVKDEKLIFKPYQGESVKLPDKIQPRIEVEIPEPEPRLSSTILPKPPEIESPMMPERVELIENLTCPNCGSATIEKSQYKSDGFISFFITSYTCLECRYSAGEF